MSKFYVEIHSEAYEELEVDANSDEEAEELALELTDLEDPVVFSIFKVEDDEDDEG